MAVGTTRPYPSPAPCTPSPGPHLLKGPAPPARPAPAPPQRRREQPRRRASLLHALQIAVMFSFPFSFPLSFHPFTLYFPPFLSFFNSFFLSFFVKLITPLTPLSIPHSAALLPPLFTVLAPSPTSHHHCLQDACPSARLLLGAVSRWSLHPEPSCPDSLLPLGILQINHWGWSQREAAAALSAPSCAHISLPPGFLSSSAGKPCPAKMLLIFA